jgi:hypothetical protein
MNKIAEATSSISGSPQAAVKAEGKEEIQKVSANVSESAQVTTTADVTEKRPDVAPSATSQSIKGPSTLIKVVYNGTSIQS